MEQLTKGKIADLSIFLRAKILFYEFGIKVKVQFHDWVGVTDYFLELISSY